MPLFAKQIRAKHWVSNTFWLKCVLASKLRFWKMWHHLLFGATNWSNYFLYNYVSSTNSYAKNADGPFGSARCDIFPLIFLMADLSLSGNRVQVLIYPDSCFIKQTDLSLAAPDHIITTRAPLIKSALSPPAPSSNQGGIFISQNAYHHLLHNLLFSNLHSKKLRIVIYKFVILPIFLFQPEGATGLHKYFHLSCHLAFQGSEISADSINILYISHSFYLSCMTNP